MNTDQLHIIMPVKDSWQTTEQAVRAIVQSGYTLTVYNDYSTHENTERLRALGCELGIEVIHIADLLSHPSPNYRWVLIHARKQALEQNAHLVIVESDVIVTAGTLRKLCLPLSSVDRHPTDTRPTPGLIAAVTHDRDQKVNFPYEYARGWEQKGTIPTRKRLSFCCTLLSLPLLRAIDFEDELNPEKNWYDVTISHRSTELGFTNLLQMDNAVLHLPHSSRPWKQLKYTNPLLYYWRKITQHKDKI